MKKIVHSAMAGSASQLLLQGSQADGLEHRVHAAVRLEQKLPGEAGDDLGEHVGHEDQQTEDRASAHPAVQQERDGDRHRPLDHERQDEDEEVVPDRALELGGGERADVVVEADEATGVGRLLHWNAGGRL